MTVVATYLKMLISMLCDMAPYLLLGFLVAGLLHSFVPSKIFSKYLSGNGFRPILLATLLGIPLPLCSCGVIPTAIGLHREHASKGAVASFLIATPQTGIDSILATFSLMGLGFAIVRPVAALITGLCGGLLVSRLIPDYNVVGTYSATEKKKSDNRLLEALRYAYIDMMENIGGHLFVGLLLAALIQIVVPDSFFLHFSKYPLIQMLLMLLIAIPMYVCSTGSIPIAAALLAKGLAPGAALVLLMAGPAVSMASFIVVRKALGKKFCYLYIGVIVVGAIFFGLLLNNIDGLLQFSSAVSSHYGHSASTLANKSLFKIICGIILGLLLLNMFIMKWFKKNKKQEVVEGTVIYQVEGMNCNHCKASVEKALMDLKGVKSAVASLEKHNVVVEGSATEQDVRKAVESVGFEFKGRVEPAE